MSTIKRIKEVSLLGHLQLRPKVIEYGKQHIGPLLGWRSSLCSAGCQQHNAAGRERHLRVNIEFTLLFSFRNHHFL